MKKQKKLRLHRETVLQLDARTLSRANGGDEWTGCVSECTACPGDKGYTQPAMFEGAAGIN